MYALFALAASFFLFLIGLIIVQAKNEAALLASRQKGMAYDLGEDWMVDENEVGDYAYSFDTSSKGVSAANARAFSGLLGEAASMRPFAEIERELNVTTDAMEKRRLKREHDESLLGVLVNGTMSIFGLASDAEADGHDDEVQVDNIDEAIDVLLDSPGPSSGDYYRTVDVDEVAAWKTANAERLQQVRSEAAQANHLATAAHEVRPDGGAAPDAIDLGWLGDTLQSVLATVGVGDDVVADQEAGDSVAEAAVLEEWHGDAGDDFADDEEFDVGEDVEDENEEEWLDEEVEYGEEDWHYEEEEGGPGPEAEGDACDEEKEE